MTIDATVAGSGANSYLTVAAADALMASDLGSFRKKWEQATLEEKEAALIRATEEIDMFAPTADQWSVAILGLPRQRLQFPRARDIDWITSLPLIPNAVLRSTAVQAAFLLVHAETLDAAAGFRARGLTNFSNPDGTSGTVADDASFGRLHPRAAAILGSVSEGAIIGTIVTT